MLWMLAALNLLGEEELSVVSMRETFFCSQKKIMLHRSDK